MTGKTIEEVISKLEEDAELVLRFMASNGLVANPTKTTFMVLNHKGNEKTEVRVGNSIIQQEQSSKLLGIKIEDTQKWDEQIKGKGGVVNALNQRLFFIRRLKKQLNKDKITKVVNSIWCSKLRYGLQLYASTRTEESQPTTKNMEILQKTQNNMLRAVENVKISDKRSIKKMLDNQNLLSVNQTMAQIKATEMWKAINTDKNPLHLLPRQVPESGRITRSNTEGKMEMTGISTLSQCSFIEDSKRLWNQMPESVKKAKTIYKAKKEIKQYCRSLPI